MAARSTEERIALIDAKISKKQEEIKTLEARGRDRGEAGA